MASRAGIDSMWTDRGADGPVRVDLRAQAGQEVVVRSNAGPDAGLFTTEVGIGQYGVTVLDHANGMATFAAGGKRAQAHFVREVTKAGARVYAEQLSQSDIGLTGQQVDELTATLSQVPSAKLSNGWDAAGKTGTWQSATSTTHNAHTWMVGYTRALAVAVWLGTTDGKPLVTTDGNADVFGSTHPATIWRQFMLDATTRLGLDPAHSKFGRRPNPLGRRRPSAVTHPIGGQSDHAEARTTSRQTIQHVQPSGHRSDAGAGRAICQPCPRSHPRSNRTSWVSASGIPSATVRRPRAWAMMIIDMTRAASLVLLSIDATKLRSILISRMGRRRRWCSDEYPVPKSSRDTATPRSVMRLSTVAARAGSVETALSVTSTCKNSGGIWWYERRSAMRSTISSVYRSRALTLIDTRGLKPARRHAASWAVASSMTRAVSKRMVEVFSTTWRMVRGSTGPRSGCVQRRSASTPSMSPVRRTI